MARIPVAEYGAERIRRDLIHEAPSCLDLVPLASRYPAHIDRLIRIHRHGIRRRPPRPKPTTVRRRHRLSVFQAFACPRRRQNRRLR